MRKVSVLSGIGLLALALLSFKGNDECQKIKEKQDTETILTELQQPFISELQAQNKIEPLSVEAIVFVETEEEINLGFDTAGYLPIGFNAYAGLELDLDEIDLVEIEEEIELGFDTAKYLPLGFDAYAEMGTNPKMSLRKGKDEKSLIVALDAQTQDSKIKLMDEDAKPIYFETISVSDYAKRFNLKNLAVGTYYFSIENAETSVVYTLSLNSNEVSITNTAKNDNKPVFRKTGDKVFLNLFNGDQQKVHIEIVDSRSNIVFKESNVGNLVIAKAFNFEKALKGSYTIRVQDGDEIFYQNITIG